MEVQNENFNLKGEFPTVSKEPLACKLEINGQLVVQLM